MDKKDGGPAFPIQSAFDSQGYAYPGTGADGMSLRDWFAGQALKGMFSNPNIIGMLGVQSIANEATSELCDEARNITLASRHIAEDMLEEMDK